MIMSNYLFIFFWVIKTKIYRIQNIYTKKKIQSRLNHVTVLEEILKGKKNNKKCYRQN